MSEQFVSLVPQLLHKEDVYELIDKITLILQKEGIIEQKQTACAAGNFTKAYRPGPSSKDALQEHETQFPQRDCNGFAIDISSQFHSGGDNKPEEVICPICKNDVADSIDLQSIYNESRQDKIPHLRCPVCDTVSLACMYDFRGHNGEHVIAYGPLALTFWNWPPLSEDFIRELENQANMPVKIVCGRLD